MSLDLHKDEIIGKIKQLNYMDLIIFLIPFIIFTIYLYVFNPGIISYDSYNQLHQIASNKFTNWHPFFHTFIVMLCIKVYETPASYCVFQISVFSIMWMVICKYFRKTRRHFLIQVIVTLIISLIPINALYAITIWKDVLFGYFLMFTCFLVKVLVDISSEDSAKIHNLISEKNITKYYKITYADPTYGHSNHKIYDNNKMDYILIAVKYSISHPFHFMKYLFGSAPMVWDITRDSDWIGSIYSDNNNSKDEFYKRRNTTPLKGYDNATFKNSEKGFFKKLNSLMRDSEENIISQTLFFSPALYMYLSIILLIAIHLITRSKTIYLVYLPNLLNILIVFLSTPIQDVRYLYPNFLICYMLIIILLCSNGKLKNIRTYWGK